MSEYGHEHKPIMSLDERYEWQKEQRMLKRRKETKLAVSMQRTLGDIEFALRKHRGILKDAAEFLGTTRSVLRRKIMMTPSLERLLKDIEQENIDIAERKLMEQVDEGNMTAISLTLRTKGKDRGYTERGTLEQEVGEGVIRTSAALIEAMRRGATESEPETVTVEAKWLSEQENPIQQS